MAITRPDLMPEIFDRLGPWINRIGPALFRTVTAGVKYIQFGQMQSALHRLNDEQLDQIGVRRSEITEYARQLIFTED
jgi:uncharacterized protein YjiS (DUF1127 family)